MQRAHRFIAAVNAACGGLLQAVRACRGFRYGYDVARIAMACILLAAAGLKGYQLATEPVLGTRFLESRWFLIAVVEFELLFGLWLVSTFLPLPSGREAGDEDLTWLAAPACFSVFACISLYKALSGCATRGCFGALKVNSWLTAMMVVFIVIARLFYRRRRSKPPLHIDLKHLSVRVVGVVAIWVAVGVPAGYAMGTVLPATLSDAGSVLGDRKIVVLAPEKWIGKRFPLLHYIDIRNRIGHGHWCLLLCHRNCPRCLDALYTYARLSNDLAHRSERTRVALIEAPSQSDELSPLVSVSASCLSGRLSDANDCWLMTRPLKVVLDWGRVASVGVD